MKDRIKAIAPWIFVALAVGVPAFILGRCGAEPAAEDSVTEGETWTCAMHPQILRGEPGECPICGMDLVPLSSLEGDEVLGEDQVALSPRARALAGVRTAEAVAGASDGQTLRLSGRVEVDETSERTVTSWVGGRIDRLHARVTGQEIRRGQTIATVYSPEVYAAQRDLRTASRQLERLAGGTELARSAATATLESARERLRLLGIPETEIERMQTRDTPTQRVAIRSPFGGTVLERLATEGTYVTPGAPLYRLADLSRLWVQLDAYERDLPRLEVGQTVALVVDGLPEERFEGRVAFVDPVVDPARRTAQVRVEVDNPDGRLRPGMFAEAIVRGSSISGLTIPATAPLFTGHRSIVYVEVPGRSRPTYEARVVRLGARRDDVYPVLEGLEVGERVVVHGAFAIDADLQIRGGESMMARDPAPDVSAEAFAPVVEAYLDVQRALAEDDLPAAKRAAAAALRAAAGAPELAARMTDAESVAEAEDLAAARVAFEPLSTAITRLLRSNGNPTERPLRLAFCPMAFENRGAEWVQASDEIDNAYFGEAMRTCGSFRQTFAPQNAAAEAESEAAEAPAPTSRPTRRRGRAAPSPSPPAGGQAGQDHSAHDHSTHQATPAPDPHAGHRGHEGHGQ